jgi:hypothetical protein
MIVRARSGRVAFEGFSRVVGMQLVGVEEARQP